VAGTYRIDIAGRIPRGAVEELAGTLAGMSLETSSDRTTLRGTLADSAALYGLIARLEAFGLALLAITPTSELDRADPSPQNRGMTDTASSPRSKPGFYERRVFPRILDVVMNTKQTRSIRARVCAPLRGDVLEIGFGTGHNLPFIPPAVTKLYAVDPLARGPELARERIEAAPFDVELVGLDGQQLPLPDASVDAALSTWTLCSIDDPVTAIREIARVLRPGGVLHFVEHGLSPDDRVRTWQNRCNPLQRKIACGCNMNRDLPASITAAGMTLLALDTYYSKGDPKVLGWTFEGRASADPGPPDDTADGSADDTADGSAG
jgi:SAM-dependent methyltransferase